MKRLAYGIYVFFMLAYCQLTQQQTCYYKCALCDDKKVCTQCEDGNFLANDN